MPIEAVGRKDPALAAALKGERSAPERKVGYYVGKRPLKLGKETLQPGDEIPEAARFPRLESWIRSGAIVEGEPNSIEPQPFSVASAGG